MSVQLRSIFALLSGVAVLGLANSLMFTLLGIRMSMDGVSDTMTGIVGSAYFVGMLGSRALAAIGFGRRDNRWFPSLGSPGSRHCQDDPSGDKTPG